MKNLILIMMIGLFISSCGDTNSTGKDATTSAVTATPAPAPAESGKYEAIPWVGLSDVEGLVKKKPKKILVDVYTPWCGPCKMMDRMTFKDEKVVNVVGESFYPVKFNAEGPDQIKFMGKDYGNPSYNPARAKTRNSKHELAGFFAVRGYPTLVVLDENMKIVDKIVGFKQPDQLLEALQKHL